MNDERIAVELNRLGDALRDKVTAPDRYSQLYAAQQALAWAADEQVAAAPYDVIAGGMVQPPIADTPAS